MCTIIGCNEVIVYILIFNSLNIFSSSSIFSRLTMSHFYHLFVVTRKIKVESQVTSLSALEKHGFMYIEVGIQNVSLSVIINSWPRTMSR